VSPCFDFARNFFIAWRTCAIGRPRIEPETSTRKNISRGGVFFRRSSSFGCTISMK